LPHSAPYPGPGERSAGHENHSLGLLRHRSRQLVVDIHAHQVGHHQVAQDRIEAFAGGKASQRFAGTTEDRHVVLA
jgi:hypothetical protein